MEQEGESSAATNDQSCAEKEVDAATKEILIALGELEPEEGENESTLGRDSSTPRTDYCGGIQVITGVVPEGMTPHQWKVALRRERKALRSKEALMRRKEKDKQRKKERKLEKKKKKVEERLAEPKGKRRRMEDSPCAVRVAIDLNYDSLMSEKDIKKVMLQCQRCYASNRRAENPLQLYLTSFSDETERFWDGQYDSYKNWDLHRHKEGFVELFGKENIVFLTSDSPNVLTDIAVDKVYVIGGFVDHNHHKGYCYKQALEMGVDHAQLPITQYVQLNSRTVLAICHVFEILLEFIAHKDWEKAFYTVIPPRKLCSPTKSEVKTESAIIQDVKEEGIQPPTPDANHSD